MEIRENFCLIDWNERTLFTFKSRNYLSHILYCVKQMNTSPPLMFVEDNHGVKTEITEVDL